MMTVTPMSDAELCADYLSINTRMAAPAARARWRDASATPEPGKSGVYTLKRRDGVKVVREAHCGTCARADAIGEDEQL
jgi:hypothetical protein